jgi:hypothetical protein
LKFPPNIAAGLRSLKITEMRQDFAVSGFHIGGSNFRENNVSFDFVWKYEEKGKFI